MFAPERDGLPCDPHGHPGRSEAIAALTVDAIGAFADVEHNIGEVEPPGGEPEALERLGALRGLQRQVEREAGSLPVATTKGHAAGIEAVGGPDRCDASAARVTSV